MTKKRLSTWSPKQRHIWQHNGFLGHAAMMKKQTSWMLNAPSLTPEAKKIADQIYDLAVKLSEELKTRIDPWKEEK